MPFFPSFPIACGEAGSRNRAARSGGVPIARLVGSGEPVPEKAVGILRRAKDQAAKADGFGETQFGLLVGLVRLARGPGRREARDSDRVPFTALLSHFPSPTVLPGVNLLYVIPVTTVDRRSFILIISAHKSRHYVHGLSLRQESRN